MPVYSLTKKITLEREDYFLLPGYTMSDLGFIQQVLEHVSNPAKTMMVEDYNTMSIRYTQKYRDMHPFMFQTFQEALDNDLAMVDKTPGERIKYYIQVTDACERIDWGYHEPTLVKGHEYLCNLYIAEDATEEIQFLEYLVERDCDLEEDECFRSWWRNAIQVCKKFGFIYGGVKMWRCIYWCKHIGMFSYDGNRNEFADEWDCQIFKSLLNQVVVMAVPFYMSGNFGEKKARKDEWQVTKNQSCSLAHTRQEGQLMEAPPKARSNKIKRVILPTRLGLEGYKHRDRPTFIFKFETLPNPDTTIEKGELTDYQLKQLERQYKARFFQLCDDLDYQEK